MLTSPRNPRIAAATRLKKRAFREADGRFLVEGAQAVSEALEEPAGLETLFATDDLDPLVVRAGQAGVEIQLVSDDVMAQAHLHGHASGPGRGGSVPRRRAGGAPRHRLRRGAPRGARPRQRRDRAALGRRRRRHRHRVHRDIGRRLQPQDRPRLRRFALPPPRGARRLGPGRRSTRCTLASFRILAMSADAAARPLPHRPLAGPSPSCSGTRPVGCPRRWPRWRMPVCACPTRGAPSR